MSCNNDETDEAEPIGSEEASSEEKDHLVDDDETGETNEADRKGPLHQAETEEEDDRASSSSGNQEESLDSKLSDKVDFGNGSTQMSPERRSFDAPGKSPFQQKQVQQEQAIPDKKPVYNEKMNGRKMPVTCLPSGSDPALRIQGHDQLMRFESRRRSEMALQLDIQGERWNAAKDITKDAISSIESVERLVIGFAKAGKIFAGNLRATSEDKLIDEKGEIATSSYTQNRLSKQRESSNEMDTGSALSSAIMECQSVLANQAQCFDDNSQQMLGLVLPQVVELKANVREKAKEVEILGESIIEDMKKSENDVITIWNALDAMVNNDIVEQSVHGSMHDGVHGSIHGGSMHGGSMLDTDGIRSVNFRKKGIMKQMGAVEDGWLVAQFYKIAYSYQKVAADFNIEELDKVIQKIVSIEENRLKKLHSLLSDGFFRRQLDVFSSVPNFDNSLLKMLEDFQIDAKSLEIVLDDRCLKRLKHSQSHRSSIMNRSSVIGGITDSLEMTNIAEEFGDPFNNSNKILLSKVVDLKKPGGLGGIVAASWTTALAVVTKYGILHVIGLPKEKGIRTEASPLEASQALYPNLKFESANAWTVGRKREIVQTLTPVVSLNLTKCSFNISKMQKQEFSVSEEGDQLSRNRFFKGNAGGKCTMRLESGKDASEWIEILKETKRDLLAGPKKKEPESKEPK